MKRLLICGLLLAFVAVPPVTAQDLPTAVHTKKEMVVTANPLATAAGEAVLRRGGTAVDAMIAAQTVLGLVEPQSSGLGGGAFVVYYDARRDRLTTIDAREKAPAAAGEDRFVGLSFATAWQSGLSVGVPGVPRMMEHLYREHGRLPWPALFWPAYQLARDGFALTERTSSQVAGLLANNPSCDQRLFFRDPTALAYFADPDTCVAKPAGTLVTNPAYAHTLAKLAWYGADAFYHGPIAADIAAAVQSDANIPGDMTADDLANYDVVERAPVCIDYRGYDVCGMGPPSSGGLAVGQILGILENFDLSGLAPLDLDSVHLFTQAGRLAFADRNLYVADSDFVTVPAEGMLDKDYLATRASLITDVDMGTAAPGTPPGNFDPTAPDATAKNSGTSHVSIVDRYGNALSMTTTVESSFGNGVMVHGFLLNNELTDFAFTPTASDGTPVANRVEANKRPRSSMSPTIVLERGDGHACNDARSKGHRQHRPQRPCGPRATRNQVRLVTGSPGGSRIIGYTAQSIINVFDFGLDPQQAINVPHYMNRNGRTDIEPPQAGVTLDYDAQALADALTAIGHSVGIVSQDSGLSIIQVTDHGLIGGADYRRDGAVGGR